jgi:hypothetical protein
MRGRAERLTRQVDRRVNRLLVEAPRVRAWTGAMDRRANVLLLRSWPGVERLLRRLRRLASRAWRRLRPVAVRLFRLLSALERRLLRTRDLAIRAATRASAVVTPQRAIGTTIVASAACLAVAQFVEYRAVEIGQPGYAGLPAATPPTVAAETAGEAHAYLLAPVALLAAALAMAAMRTPRRRGEKSTPGRLFGPSAARRRLQGLGRVVFLLGLLSLAVVLLVDLPAGLDAGAETSRFSGATAVLFEGFYAEIAAATGLMLGGALLILAPKAAARYHARPCRTRTNLFARAASVLRRRRRPRASSRARATRRRSRRRSGGVSAPASPP